MILRWIFGCENGMGLKSVYDSFGPVHIKYLVCIIWGGGVIRSSSTSLSFLIHSILFYDDR